MYINLTESRRIWGSDAKVLNYIWNLESKTFRPPKFNLEEYHQLQVPGEYRSSNSDSLLKSKPLYYVDLEKERILAIKR